MASTTGRRDRDSESFDSDDQPFPQYQEAGYATHIPIAEEQIHVEGPIAMDGGNGYYPPANGFQGAGSRERPRETYNPQPATEPPQDEGRQLNFRQIQMLAIGSAIGNGVLIQSGTELYNAGPVSLLLAFIFVSSVVISVMLTMGEMISFIPEPGGFITLANRCLSRAIVFSHLNNTNEGLPLWMVVLVWILYGRRWTTCCHRRYFGLLGRR